jgi:hypothetical protein
MSELQSALNVFRADHCSDQRVFPWRGEQGSVVKAELQGFKSGLARGMRFLSLSAKAGLSHAKVLCMVLDGKERYHTSHGMGQGRIIGCIHRPGLMAMRGMVSPWLNS